MASSSHQQQAKSFSSVDEKIKSQPSRTKTSCVQINETLSSSETGKDEQFICPKCEDIDLPDSFSSQNLPMHVPFQTRGKNDLDPECSVCPLVRDAWSNKTIQEVPSAAINNFLAPKIDFTILKSWIEDCSHNHGPECAAIWSRDSISGLKLIKIEEKRIVNASQEGGPYAALSYVWGSGPQGSPRGDKLPAEMPKTIVDAMNVALELDLEYIWVDRYCITQDDSEEKNDQISKMHHIFRQSHVTIGAAAGDDPNHGIPGMSIPRTPPAHTVFKGRVFISLVEIPNTAGPVPRSKWHTRAWTYQEEILSRRIIYFTDSQSFFHCHQEQNSNTFGIEDPVRNLIKPNNGRLRCERARVLERIQEQSPNTNLKFTKSRMRTHILEVNGRDLTYESDRVNAVAGMLGHWQHQGVIVGHLSGSPIFQERFSRTPQTIMSWEEGFLSGIATLLARGNRHTRREEFPSWSWAGWKGWDYFGPGFYTYMFVRGYNIRIWIELDTTATSILSSVDGVPKPLVSNSVCSKICLPSREFQKIAQSLIFKGLACRFIRIEAPVIHCQVKRLDPIPLGTSGFTGSNNWILHAVEGHQFRQMSGIELRKRKVDFTGPADYGSNQERELLSSPLKGLLMIAEKGTGNHGYVVFVQKLGDYFEILGSWRVFPTQLPILLQVRNEEGFIRPLFKYDPGKKPKTEVLLKKEIIRLG